MNNRNIVYVEFNKDLLDDFFYWKRIIEDGEAKAENREVKRATIDKFIEKIGMFKSVYSDASTEENVPFGIYDSLPNYIIIFYISKNNEVVNRLKTALSEINYNLNSLENIKVINVNDIIDKDRIYYDNKTIWIRDFK